VEPRQPLGVDLAERLLAQSDQRGAVFEGSDFDIGGVFCSRCEARRQVGDPADPWFESSLAGGPGRVGDVGKVEGVKENIAPISAGFQTSRAYSSRAEVPTRAAVARWSVANGTAA